MADAGLTSFPGDLSALNPWHWLMQHCHPCVALWPCAAPCALQPHL